MPFPVVAALGAAAALGSSAFNAASVGKTNRKSRHFAKEMYDRQRSDALADWHMSNDYNSPAEQMKRLKAAGLNPNLVYDNGGAAAMSGSVRSSSAPGWSPDAPRIDSGAVASSLFAGYDVMMKQAQTDNVKAATEVAKQDAALKAAQTASTITSNSQSKFNLKMAENLENISLEKAGVELGQSKATLQYTLNNDERQAALTKNTLSKSIEEVLNLRIQRSNTIAQTDKIRQEIINLKKDATIKDLDINLRKLGIMPGDPMYMRMVAQYFSGDSFNESQSLDPKGLRSIYPKK